MTIDLEKLSREYAGKTLPDKCPCCGAEAAYRGHYVDLTYRCKLRLKRDTDTSPLSIIVPCSATPKLPDGFTPWYGSERPVDGNVKVKIITRNGHDETRKAKNFRWNHANAPDDIVAYRILPDPAALAPEPLPEIPDGYIRWSGGTCPLLDDNVKIEVILRNKQRRKSLAKYYRWGHTNHHEDIIAYRVPDQRVEEKPAAAAPLPSTELDSAWTSTAPSHDVSIPSDMTPWLGLGKPPLEYEQHADLLRRNGRRDNGIKLGRTVETCVIFWKYSGTDTQNSYDIIAYKPRPDLDQSKLSIGTVIPLARGERIPSTPLPTTQPEQTTTTPKTNPMQIEPNTLPPVNSRWTCSLEGKPANYTVIAAGQDGIVLQHKRAKLSKIMEPHAWNKLVKAPIADLAPAPTQRVTIRHKTRFLRGMLTGALLAKFGPTLIPQAWPVVLDFLSRFTH